MLNRLSQYVLRRLERARAHTHTHTKGKKKEKPVMMEKLTRKTNFHECNQFVIQWIQVLRRGGGSESVEKTNKADNFSLHLY